MFIVAVCWSLPAGPFAAERSVRKLFLVKMAKTADKAIAQVRQLIKESSVDIPGDAMMVAKPVKWWPVVNVAEIT